MLSASLSILSASPLNVRKPSNEEDANESQPLLGWRRPPSTEEEGMLQKKPAALSAFLGISAGTGALLAVFLYLRIPTWFSTSSSNSGLTNQGVKGLKIAFYIVGGVAVLNATIAFFALPSKKPLANEGKQDDGLWAYFKHEIRQIFNGFRLAGKNANIALACFGGFAARAQTISIS